ncbi:MAG: nucleotidyl transferase AbiEii/AbiGii toxin family protein [Acidobacteriota bacterium]|nr:nucleotidyl transferase AbiEii/AbiGii toxin family protein [Acidobacteriota bacterium]
MEPTWDEKVLRIDAALAARGLAYAFGGAIALNYHREPRSTLDIDVNIFVSPADQVAVLDALADAHQLEERSRLAEELAQDGQTRALWGDTFIDVFLANTAFHESMAGRVQRQPFGGREIPVLSIEDLLVCKVLFDRPKDWLDMEAVADTRAGELDTSYVVRWLEGFLGASDERVARTRALLTRG